MNIKIELVSIDKTILYIPSIKLTPADMAVVPNNLFSEFILSPFYIINF